jgi:hypothetical protein
VQYDGRSKAMPWDTALPFGIRDTKVTPYTTSALTTLGTSTDVPNARTLSFSEAEDYEELRGDDKVVAIRGLGATVEWEMENGGISIPAYKNMNGGTTTTTGVSPAQVTTYTKKVTDERPYFKAEGQAMSDLGGDFHGVLYRSRASGGVEGEMADGAFWLTGASGVALPALLTGKVDTLYEFILNETAVAIT